MQHKVVYHNGATVQAMPSASSAQIQILALGDIVDAVQDHIPDATDPSNANKVWVQLVDGHYVASNYPDAAGPQVRLVLVTPPVVTKTHTVDVFQDGSITVDGKPIP